MTLKSDAERSHFLESARACLANGNRLLTDAEWLEYQEPPSTAFALAIIAQEEFAKGFLLYLVSRGVIPWNALLFRATRDHTCKQLLGPVMDHIFPVTEEYLRRMDEWSAQHKEAMSLLKALETTEDESERQKIWQRIHEIDGAREALPATVADAIFIFRHEKIGRWESSAWDWVEDPQYDEAAKQLFKGKLDEQKQDAIYVRLNRDGTVNKGIPLITTDVARQVRENAERFGKLLEQLLKTGVSSILDFEKIESAFKSLFASLTTAAAKD